MLSALVFAAALRIKLVYVPAPKEGLTQVEFNLFASDLKNYLQRNVSTRIRIVRRIANVSRPLDLSMGDALRMFDILTTLHDPSFAMSHYVFPLVRIDGYPYVLGYSNGICTVAPKTNSYSTALIENADGYSRYWESIAAAAHEIGHQLGGKHRNKGLMSYMVLGDSHTEIPLPSNETKRDWQRCGKL